MSGNGSRGLCKAGCHGGINGCVACHVGQKGWLRGGRTGPVAAGEIGRGSRFHCMMHTALPQNCSDSYGFCKLALPLPLFWRKARPAGMGWAPEARRSW